jgi:hypothetical protein
MKLFCPMEMKEFDQAKARTASVNRTAIRCRRTPDRTLLHLVRNADEKFQAFSIHCRLDHGVVQGKSV